MTYKLSDGWYDDGYFIRSLQRDGHSTGWLWRETGRGLSSMVDKVNAMLSAADAGVPLTELAAANRELVPSADIRPAVDTVLRDAKELSSGTMATLIGEMNIPSIRPGLYDVVERVRNAFVAHIEGGAAQRFSAWQDTWSDFAATPQAIDAASGGLAHAKGTTVQYELQFADGSPTSYFLSLSELDVASRSAIAVSPLGDQGQIEAMVYRRLGDRQVIAKTRGHRLSDGRSEVRPLIGWEHAQLAPVESATKAAPTFAELFGGTRDSLRRLGESWHRARGQTPVEYLELFASLTDVEQVHVIKALRVVKPNDGEPMDWLVSRRAVAVQQALDAIQESRGLPPILPGPPPDGYEVGYILSDGDKLEAVRIATTVVKFFGASTPAVVIKTEVDSDGWHWVRVADMDGHPLKMGTGGFQVGAVQCSTAAEANAMATELRRVLDNETRRVSVGSIKKFGSNDICSMPGHVARRLGLRPAADAVQSSHASEEAESCAFRPR